MDFQELIRMKSLYDTEDKQGGEEPQISTEALKTVDFITYPDNVKGSNCGNCSFNDNGICQQEEIKGQPVNEHNCCGRWDAPGTLRDWQHSGDVGQKNINNARRIFANGMGFRLDDKNALLVWADALDEAGWPYVESFRAAVNRLDINDERNNEPRFWERVNVIGDWVQDAANWMKQYKHIEKSGSGYDLRAKHGSHRVLGHHKTKKDAIKQEQAIEISKHAHGKSLETIHRLIDAELISMDADRSQVLADALEDDGYRNEANVLRDYVRQYENKKPYESAEKYLKWWRDYLHYLRANIGKSNDRFKAMSAMNELSGGSLMPPAKQSRFAKSILEARNRRK